MRILLLFLFIFFSFTVNAANTVRIYDVSKLTSISGQTNYAFTLVAEPPSGDATSESAPAKVYAPMETTTVANSANYFYLNSSGGSNYALFGYSTNAVTKLTYRGYNLTFPLLVSVDTVAKYLYAAVKVSPTSYVIVANYGSLINSTTNGQVSFNVSPQDICAAAVNSTTNCSDFDENDAPTVEVTKAMTVYFFVSSDSLSVGTADIGAPGSAYEGGVFFQVYLSNQVYTNSELRVTLDDLRRGDKRVIGTFSSSSTMTTYYKGAYAYIHSSNTDNCAGVREPGNCQGGFRSEAISSSQNAGFTVANLPNGSEVTVSVALRDKFGFSTTLSNSIKATPTSIEELLKKQACFLLTAGFGEEHYVINYFRNYRDHILLKSWLGQKLIETYYGAAPRYALIIYKSEILRFGIRTLAYFLYFLFNYHKVILLLILSYSFLKVVKNKLIRRSCLM